MEKKRKTKSKVKSSIESPVVRYDPRLNQYEGQILFPRQYELAMERIKNSNFEEFIKEFEKKQKENKHK